MGNNSALSTEQRDAFRLDAELKQHAGTVVSEMIEVGKCLKEINERRLYEYLGTGSFAEYAEKAVGLKERAAYNYITAYETYGAEGLRKYGELGITKLVALAQLNDADRAEMLESGEAAEISTRALNDRIKELKHETDQLRFENETLSDKVAIASQLDATGIYAEGRNKKGKVAKKIKDVKKFVIGFSISRNVTTATGIRSLYVRITTPTGDVLSKGGTFAYENRQLEYSIRKDIEYTGEEQSVVVYWDVAEALSAGNYRVDIFADGQNIGRTNFAFDK